MTPTRKTIWLLEAGHDYDGTTLVLPYSSLAKAKEAQEIIKALPRRRGYDWTSIHEQKMDQNPAGD